MNRIVRENVHLGLRHFEIDLLAAQGQLVRLQFGAGEESLLGKLAAPLQLLGGALKLLVRKGDIGFALALLLGEVALLVLLELHLREIKRHLALKQIAFALSLRHPKTLLRDDEVAVGRVRRYLLVVSLLHQRSRVKFDEEIARLDVHAVLHDPQDRVAPL